MSKQPSVKHKYHPKKDFLEITIKHYALSKKSEREKIIIKLLHQLEQSAAPNIAKVRAAKKKRAKLPKSPMKDSKIQEVGD